MNVNSREPYAVVVGAVNIDIGGQSDAPLIDGDSNPGKVNMSLGGVGCNIARNMAKLGVNTGFVTVLGDDVYAHRIIEECEELGIDLSMAETCGGEATSVYLFISDSDGDMRVAVSDMRIHEKLTIEFLQSRLDYLNGAAVVLIDGNLNEAVLHWVCENVKVPIFSDPVSRAKAGKLKTVLGKLHTLKPNRIEAELLSGVEITDNASLERAAAKLLETGMRRVFISLGTDGVYAAERGGKAVLLPCMPAQTVNATGAGDAFMGALVWSFLSGFDLEKTAAVGTAAAAIAVESRETIDPRMSAENVLERVKKQAYADNIEEEKTL